MWGVFGGIKRKIQVVLSQVLLKEQRIKNHSNWRKKKKKRSRDENGRGSSARRHQQQTMHVSTHHLHTVPVKPHLFCRNSRL